MSDGSRSRADEDAGWALIVPAIVVAILQLGLTIIVGVAYAGDAWHAGTCLTCGHASAAVALGVFAGSVALAWQSTLAGIVVGYHLRRPLIGIPIVSCVVIVAATLLARGIFDAGG